MKRKMNVQKIKPNPALFRDVREGRTSYKPLEHKNGKNALWFSFIYVIFRVFPKAGDSCKVKFFIPKEATKNGRTA